MNLSEISSVMPNTKEEAVEKQLTHKRKCYLCGTSISECMGFCRAEDILKITQGEKLKVIREKCGLCVEKVHVEVNCE